MYQILLGILSFILFQIIRSQNCDGDEIELIELSLSDQEVVQIPFNELIYPSSQLILCNNNQPFDINIIQSIQQIQQFKHQTNDTVKFLKQYKTTKNRIPRQSSMIIVQENYAQFVKLNWDKDPQFKIIYQYLNDDLITLDYIDNLVLMNFNYKVMMLKVFPNINVISQQQQGCSPPPLITDQLDDIIYSISYNLIQAHNDWQKNNSLCFNTKMQFECQDHQIEIKNEITTLQIYPTQILTFISDNVLIKSYISQQNAQCELNPKILAYDYDLIKKIFVIVHPEQIEYNGEIYKLDFDRKQIQVFITKSYIILRNELTIKLFSKKLNLISTKTFQEDFQIITNQLQDQFILVDNTHFSRYLLYENSFIEINEKQNNRNSLLQDKDSKKQISLSIQYDYDNKLKNLNISKTKEVSTIFNDALFNYYQCNYDEQIMGSLQFQQYNKLLDIISYNVRVFDLDNYKIIFAFSRTYIYLGMIYNTNLQQFKKYSIQDEIITKSNCAFQIQDNKINYIHCTYLTCYLYFDIMRNYDYKRMQKIEKNNIQKVVSDNNHFYLLTSKNVIIFNIIERQVSLFQELDIQVEDAILDIFAIPKKKDYLFVLTQKGMLYLYSISLPYQDLIYIFQLNYNELKDLIIFENYFLIFIKQKEQIICNVYNYKNELNIFLQRKLPLYFFKEINLDDLQVDYDQNILYIKGQLISSNEYVIVAYRIDTRIELSIQFISKIQDQFGYLLPISNRMILRFQNKFNFTSIFYNTHKDTSCLITKFLKEDIIDDDDDDDDESDIESELDQDDTLSLDESYHFSTSSFISISSAGELLILGMQSIYGRKRHQNVDIFQPL